MKGTESSANKNLEKLFFQEDARIQSVVKAINVKIGNGTPEEVKDLTRKAKIALAKSQRYELKEEEKEEGSCDICNLIVIKEGLFEYVDFEDRKGSDICRIVYKE